MVSFLDTPTRTRDILAKHYSWMPTADLHRIAAALDAEVPVKNSTLRQRRIVRIFAHWRLPLTFSLILDLAGGSRSSAAEAMRESLSAAAARAALQPVPDDDDASDSSEKGGEVSDPGHERPYIYRTSSGWPPPDHGRSETASTSTPAPPAPRASGGDGAAHSARDPSTSESPKSLRPQVAQQILEALGMLTRDVTALTKDFQWTRTMIDDARQLTRMRQAHGVLAEPSVPTISRSEAIDRTTSSLARDYRTTGSARPDPGVLDPTDGCSE